MRESNTSMNMTVVIKRKGEDGVFKKVNPSKNEVKYVLARAIEDIEDIDLISVVRDVGVELLDMTRVDNSDNLRRGRR